MNLEYDSNILEEYILEDYRNLNKYNILKEVEVNRCQSDEKVSALIKNSNEIIFILDVNGQITYINPAIEKTLGFTVPESLGKVIYNYIHFEDIKFFQKMMIEIKDTTTCTTRTELRFMDQNNNSVWCEVLGTNFFNDPLINGLVLHVRVISEQIRIAGASSQFPYYDYLTGLPDRRSFEIKLNSEINYASKNNSTFAVLLLDLDGFKHLNNSLGHDIGNQLLKDVTFRVVSVYNEEIYFSRLGGDEFGFLLKSVKKFADIHRNAKKLVSLINDTPFKINKNEYFVSASIGVSTYPHSGGDPITLLKNAEMAMYHAKSRGKNQYQFFSPTMDVNTNKQFALRNDMNKAIHNEEFVIYYQPRVDSTTNEPIGSEALIRWNHPNLGIIPPNQFIPLAEETGLIIPIGEWVIKSVCYQIKTWLQEGFVALKTSINLSSLQLQKPNFVEMVSTILNEVGLDSKYIEFEITESVIINREDQVLKTLSQLNQIGISIALDDFGTGYSALSYLRKFPCKVIKLDKSLIDGIHNNVENYEIAAAIISLCHKLNKSVVAEGVETLEQLNLLRELSCNEIQGYIYSKPLSTYDYEKSLKKGYVCT
jgi:diguanylate cyclase (GGDEF)-like protein/PAS domain S-box-containing protein